MTDQDELCYLSATALAAEIGHRRLSPVEVVDAVLERIDRVNPQVNAFNTIIAEQARELAKSAEEEVMAKEPEELGRLHGVPITVKDLTPTAGVRTTFGVPQHKDNVPTTDGLTWARLKAEGPVLLGKTATPPLGALCVTESEIHGLTNNPWSLDRTAGGSSGGAAAALAAGFGPIATGSDGGGSIRQPSSFCGVVGLKGSRGRIPLYTEGPVFETVDVVGPMTRTVEDCALMLTIMAGPHPRDPYSLLDSGVDYVGPLAEASVKGTPVAFCMELGRGPVERDVAEGVQRAAETFESLGALVEWVEVDMPDLMDYFMAYWAPSYALFMGEDSGYDFSRYPTLVEWIEAGKHVKAVDHLEVQLITREKMHLELAKVLERFMLLVTPTTPTTAFPHPDEITMGPTEVAGRRVSIPGIDSHRLTDPPSNAGLPALSLPCGFSPDGLPIGLQIIGRHGADASVLGAAAAFERAAQANQMPEL